MNKHIKFLEKHSSGDIEFIKENKDYLLIDITFQYKYRGIYNKKTKSLYVWGYRSKKVFKTIISKEEKRVTWWDNLGKIDNMEKDGIQEMIDKFSVASI